MRLLIIVKNTSKTSFYDALIGMRYGENGIHNQIYFIFSCILKTHIMCLYLIVYRVQGTIILSNTVVRMCARNPNS